MTVPVFFVPEGAIKGDKAVISDPEDIHHALRVLRIRIGDDLILYDGTGMGYKAVLEKVGSDRIICGIVEKEEVNWRPAEISILIGLLKGDKNEFVIREATELGIKEILISPMRRSVSRISDGTEMIRKERRFKKVSIEACRQCGRPIPPSVSVLRWEEALDIIKGSDLILVPWEEERERKIWELVKGKEWKGCAVVIGPEGGFDPEEVEELKGIGGIPVSLGYLRLRSEMAVVFSISILLYELSLRVQ